MLRADDDLDEEELQELQTPVSPVRQQPKHVVDENSLTRWMCSELWRLAQESPQHCAAVLTLLLLSVAVICFAVVRDMRHDWKSCDENTKMAKHF